VFGAYGPTTRCSGRFLLALSVFGAALLAPGRADAECSTDAAGGSWCLFRSIVPSSGIVASCRTDRDCRVGYYYGDPASAAVWFSLPQGWSAFPKPDVTWIAGTLAQVRFDCGWPCSVSYFFEVRRRRLSGPRKSVLAVDARRLLLAMVEDRALVVRQMFSGREVTRIERDWAPSAWVGDAITQIRFDPDGRLAFTWLGGADRAPVTERLSVPTVAR